MSEIWNLNTLCRCCHADGNFKSLNLSYQGENEVEIYETMLRETLGISMCSSLEASYTICDNCILALRNASTFKNQVLMCEQKLQVYCCNEQFLNTHGVVKFEADNSDNESNDVCNIVDNHPIEDYKEDEQFVNTLDVVKSDAATIDINLNDENQPKYEITIQKVTSEVKRDLNSDVPTTIKKNIRRRRIINKNIKGRKKGPVLDRSLIIEMEVDSGTQFSCKDCGGLYQTKKDIKQHIYKAHSTLFKCEYCSKQLKTLGTYKKHLNLHTGNKIQCSYCPKKFASKQSLKDHLNCHTREIIYKCDICQKDFKYKQSLVKHLEAHAGTSKKKLCDLCGWSFNDRSNLDAHVRTVHQKLRPYQCKLCDKSYTSKRHLRDHLKLHSDDEAKYKCEICNHRLTCQKSIEIHRLKHDGKFMCRYCSKIFDSVALRKEHVQDVHPVRLKEYPCPICGKVLAGQHSLNRHVNDHKGIKNFPCDLCGIKFSQKVSLNRHIFRKHNPNADINIGKTKCNICKHSYKNITLHMISHDKRLFGCEICGKTYPDNRGLNIHKLSKHFGRTFACDVCDKKYIQKAKLHTHMNKVHKIKIEKDSSKGS